MSSAPLRQDSESVLKHGNEGLFGDGRILSLAKGLNQWIRTQNGINDDPETRGLEYTDSQQPGYIRSDRMRW